MDTIADKIRALFTQKKIGMVLYVDDDFEKEVYKQKIVSYLRENIDDTRIEWPFPVNAGFENARYELDNWMESVSKDLFQEFVKKHHIERNRNEIEEKLLDCLPQNILVCLTPSDFKENYIDNNGFVPSEDNQLLILIDKYLKEEESNSGMRLIAPFMNRQWISCGLFSNKFQITEELSQWQSINMPKNIFPLSKERIYQDGGGAFLPGLRNVLWLSQISEIKTNYIEMCRNAVESISTFFDEIDPASFDKVIMAESAKEGCWEYETLHRVGVSVIESKMEEQLSTALFDKTQKQLGLLREIKNICEQELPNNTELAKDIMLREQYAKGDFINKIYSPLSNGDIFKIGSDLYILLCQPCNLEIREDGHRKVGDWIHLIPIVKASKKELPYTRHITIDTEEMILKYTQSKLVAATILDLVSFNEDGAGMINLETDTPYAFVRPNMAKRYSLIKKCIRGFVDKYNAINTQESKRAIGGIHEDIKNSFLNPICKGGFLKEPVPVKSQTGVIDFKVTREMRLKDPYAQAYLQEFMAYLSRPAFPLQLQ